VTGKQLDLSLPPAARNTDPATSHAAEAATNRSGSRARQCAEILELVRLNPGRLVSELAEMQDKLTRNGLAKRVSDLVNTGRCYYGNPSRDLSTGRQCNTVWPTTERKRQ